MIYQVQIFLHKRDKVCSEEILMFNFDNIIDAVMFAQNATDYYFGKDPVLSVVIKFINNESPIRCSTL